MSVTIFNRLIVSPGKNHRPIANFIRSELGVESIDTRRIKEHLRIEFISEDRPATFIVKSLFHHFPDHRYDFIWLDEYCQYVKSFRVNEHGFHTISYIGWGITDYLQEEIPRGHLRKVCDIDWVALEYDLLLASQSGGFLENTKVIPELIKEEAIDLLTSDSFVPDSPTAQALVMHILSEGKEIAEIPARYLSPTIYQEALLAGLIRFEQLPKVVLGEEFLIEICRQQGHPIFTKLNSKELSENICLAALSSETAPIRLKDIPSSFRTLPVCELALAEDHEQFRHVPKKILTQDFCNRFPSALAFIPNDYKSFALCKNALMLNASLLAFVPKHFITQSMVHQLLRRFNPPMPFLEHVPPEFISRSLINGLIKKNPSEFKHLPEALKSFDITKRFVAKDITNLSYTPVDMLDELLTIRSIKRAFLEYPNSLSLLPKTYLSKELILETFKARGIELDEIPNHFISEELILLAIRRHRQQLNDHQSSSLPFHTFAKNCSKPKVWKYLPEKIKDYAFCQQAIVTAHPSIEGEVLLQLLQQTPHDLDSFSDSVQWLYYFIDNKIPPSLREHYFPTMEFSEYLETILLDSTTTEDPLKNFAKDFLASLGNTNYLAKDFSSIGVEAWNLWVEICSMVYPAQILPEEEALLSSTSSRFMHCTKQLKIFNFYVVLGELLSIRAELDEDRGVMN